MIFFKITVMAASITQCLSFRSGRSAPSTSLLNRTPQETTLGVLWNSPGEITELSTDNSPLDPRVAQQFTIQVCTSTSCSKKMNQLGLDQYDTLGELYARAQEANVEKAMIIEDGGCQGGKNCKLGPCVAILHEDFDGNVALEGMGSTEFRERVFHNVAFQGDVDRVWGCVENAVRLMS